MADSKLHASSGGSSGEIASACWPPYCSGTGDVLPNEEKYFKGGMSVDLVKTGNNTPHLLVCGTYAETHAAFVLSNVHKLAQDEMQCTWTRLDLRQCGLDEPRVGHSTTELPSEGDDSEGGTSSTSLLLHGGYHGNVRKKTVGRVDRTVFGDIYRLEVNGLDTDGGDGVGLRVVPLEAGRVPDVERRWHCSFTVGSKAFFHGGWNEAGPVGSMLSFDPAGDPASRWSVVPESGDVPVARRWHTLTSLSSSGATQLCYGGYFGDPNKPLADCLIFDANALHWRSVPARGAAPGGRSRHSLTRVAEKQLMLLGGYDAHHNISRPGNGLFFFHTDEEKWEKIDQGSGEIFPMFRVGHKAIPLPDERGMILFGGYSNKMFEPLYYMDLRMLGRVLQISSLGRPTTAAEGEIA